MPETSSSAETLHDLPSVCPNPALDEHGCPSSACEAGAGYAAAQTEAAPSFPKTRCVPPGGKGQMLPGLTGSIAHAGSPRVEVGFQVLQVQRKGEDLGVGDHLRTIGTCDAGA